MPPAPPASEHRPDDPNLPPEPAPGTAWYWRFVWFLWITSFVFLFLYELLSGVLKSWYSGGGS